MESFGGALLESAFEDLFVLKGPRWSATSIKLHGGVVGVAFWHGCSPVDLVVFFRVHFYDSTSGGLLLHIEYSFPIFSMRSKFDIESLSTLVKLDH